jgi:hypothetical protein
VPLDEQDLVADFLSGLGRRRVIDFLSDVAADEGLMIELAQIELYPEPVSAFARSKGYGFTADELTAVIEARVAPI